MKPVRIMADNKSAIELAKNPAFHSHSKDIQSQYHHVRKCVENSEVKLHHVATEEQHADILTKSITKVKLFAFRFLLGLEDIKDQSRASG